ncbi:MAG: hypothetical protein ACRC6M_17380, partial [Microcystaceae cyanobacterium]
CAAAEHFDKGDRSSLGLGVQSRLSITEVQKLYPSNLFCPPSPPSLGGDRNLSEFKVPQYWGI